MQNRFHTLQSRHFDIKIIIGVQIISTGYPQLSNQNKNGGLIYKSIWFKLFIYTLLTQIPHKTNTESIYDL
jgi:hypothetical protein